MCATETVLAIDHRIQNTRLEGTTRITWSNLPCSSRRMLSGLTSLEKEARLQQDEISVRRVQLDNKPEAFLSIKN